jgi:DNA-binding NarL/FixJ family response regulator
MTTIVLADDHELVRESVASLLQEVPRFKIVSQCRDGRQLVAAVDRLQPDVAVVDISMSELNGIDAAQQIRRVSPKTRVIALSIHTEEQYIRDMLGAGASGYVVKSGAAKDLVEAIMHGSKGKVYVSKEISDTAAKIQNTATSKGQGRGQELTQREREILQLIGEGYSSGEIARKLNIGEATIKTHRNNMMDKIGVRDVAGLTRHAIRLKLVYIE